MLHTRIYQPAGDTNGFWYGPAEWELISESRSAITFRKTFSNGAETLFKIAGSFNTGTDSGRIREMKEVYRGDPHFSWKFDDPVRIKYTSDSWELNGRDFNAALRSGVQAFGNSYDNVIMGDVGNDQLFGQAGDDRLYANGGDDLLDGGGGRDRMEGGSGNDTYVRDNRGDRFVEFSGEGTDRVLSSIDFTLPSFLENLTLTGRGDIDGSGNEQSNVLRGNNNDNALNGNGKSDSLFGNGGRDALDGGAGADRMAGGAGSDRFFVDHKGDRVIEVYGEGTDSVISLIDFVLPAYVENLTLSGSAGVDGTGNALKNVMTGNSGANRLEGAGGADRLDGAGGSDWLSGGGGRDQLTGGKGADVFVFADIAASPAANPDVIRDFQTGIDQIDLASIDASNAADGDQAFVFIGDSAFSGTAGELRYAAGLVEGDQNGDGIADLAIAIINGATMTTDDFLL